MTVRKPESGLRKDVNIVVSVMATALPLAIGGAFAARYFLGELIDLRMTISELQENVSLVRGEFEKLTKEGVKTNKYLQLEFRDRPLRWKDWFRGEVVAKDPLTGQLNRYPRRPVPLAVPSVQVEERRIQQMQYRHKYGYDVRINDFQKFITHDYYVHELKSLAQGQVEASRRSQIESTIRQVSYEQELRKNPQFHGFNVAKKEIDKWFEEEQRLQALRKEEQALSKTIRQRFSVSSDERSGGGGGFTYTSSGKASREHEPLLSKGKRKLLAKKAVEEEEQVVLVQQERIGQFLRQEALQQPQPNPFVEHAMRQRLPTCNELVAFFEEEGFEIDEGARHTIVRRGPYRSAIPRHGNTEVRRGTLRAIFFQTGYLIR